MGRAWLCFRPFWCRWSTLILISSPNRCHSQTHFHFFWYATPCPDHSFSRVSEHLICKSKSKQYNPATLQILSKHVKTIRITSRNLYPGKQKQNDEYSISNNTTHVVCIKSMTKSIKRTPTRIQKSIQHTLANTTRQQREQLRNINNINLRH